jgi:peroxiredoxin
MASARQREILRAGAPAPDFRLPELANREVSLQEELARGPVLLAFFKVSCPVCQLTLPILNRIAEGRKDPSLTFFGVSQDDAGDTREFNRRFGVKFPTLLDSEGGGYPVSNAYGISSVPSLLQVEPDGKISWVLEGFSRREIQALGQRQGVNPYRPGEDLPEWKAG